MSELNQILTEVAGPFVYTVYVKLESDQVKYVEIQAKKGCCKSNVNQAVVTHAVFYVMLHKSFIFKC